MAKKKQAETSSQKKRIFVEPLHYDFLKQGKLAFVKPQRAGKKRGELIGFSQAKYALVLSYLFNPNRSPRDKAKAYKINYSLLRRWVAEPAFKATVSTMYDEFVVFFMHYVHEWHVHHKELFKKDADQPIGKLLNWSGNMDRLNHMATLKAKVRSIGWNLPLCDHLMPTLSKELDKADLEFSATLNVVIEFMVGEEHLTDEVKKKSKDIQRMAACRTLDFAKNIIAKSTGPLGERKHLLVSINQLQQQLRDGSV